MKTATVRDLRTRFPEVRASLQREGEVVITERGRPSYTLRPYQPQKVRKPPAIDYWARLRRLQARPLSASASAALDEANREER